MRSESRPARLLSGGRGSENSISCSMNEMRLYALFSKKSVNSSDKLAFYTSKYIKLIDRK